MSPKPPVHFARNSYVVPTRVRQCSVDHVDEGAVGGGAVVVEAAIEEGKGEYRRLREALVEKQTARLIGAELKRDQAGAGTLDLQAEELAENTSAEFRQDVRGSLTAQISIINNLDPRSNSSTKEFGAPTIRTKNSVSSTATFTRRRTGAKAA